MKSWSKKDSMLILATMDLMGIHPTARVLSLIVHPLPGLGNADGVWKPPRYLSGPSSPRTPSPLATERDDEMAGAGEDPSGAFMASIRTAAGSSRFKCLELNGQKSS
jgi:hypothetical protein